MSDDTLIQRAGRLPASAQRVAVLTVEVNVGPTPAGGIVDIALQGPAGEILPQIVQSQ